MLELPGLDDQVFTTLAACSAAAREFFFEAFPRGIRSGSECGVVMVLGGVRWPFAVCGWFPEKYFHQSVAVDSA